MTPDSIIKDRAASILSGRIQYKTIGIRLYQGAYIACDSKDYYDHGLFSDDIKIPASKFLKIDDLIIKIASGELKYGQKQ